MTFNEFRPVRTFEIFIDNKIKCFELVKMLTLIRFYILSVKS
jgi:hypothetical protein